MHSVLLDAAVGAMNTLNAVSLATSAIDRYLVAFMLLNVHGGEMAYYGRGQSGKGTRE